MTFLQERQNRSYFKFLSGICIWILLLSLLSGYMGLIRARNLLLRREGQLASALIEEGVSGETLAAVFSGKEVTKEGAAFLERAGHGVHVPLRFFPAVGEEMAEVFFGGLVCAVFLCVFLLAGTFFDMRRRERLYQEAADIVERFSEGDFSGRLPWEQTGTLYRLFSSVDQLSKALRSGYETEARLRESLKDTISDISHQLKTPLAALHMYTEIILTEHGRPDTVQNFARKSAQSLGRMEGLIQSLLKIARLDAGTVRFDMRPYPVQEVVQYALENLAVRAAKEKKQIVIEGNPDETLVCDLPWLGEAVGNLVKNALEHTEEGGKIHICWKRFSVMLRLSVKDDGQGIAPEHIHHIFKRFYRSQSQEDSPSGRQGTGLGLPLAKAIADGHGASLSVESRPGEGSVFTLSFGLTES